MQTEEKETGKVTLVVFEATGICAYEAMYNPKQDPKVCDFVLTRFLTNILGRPWRKWRSQNVFHIEWDTELVVNQITKNMGGYIDSISKVPMTADLLYPEGDAEDQQCTLPPFVNIHDLDYYQLLLMVHKGLYIASGQQMLEASRLLEQIEENRLKTYKITRIS